MQTVSPWPNLFCLWLGELIQTYHKCLIKHWLYSLHHSISGAENTQRKYYSLSHTMSGTNSLLCLANEDHHEGCPCFLQARTWLIRPMRDWQVRLQWRQVKVSSGFGVVAALCFLLCRFSSMTVLREDSKEEPALLSVTPCAVVFRKCSPLKMADVASSVVWPLRWVFSRH